MTTEELIEENKRLKKKLSIFEKAYEPIYKPKTFMILDDDAKPVRQCDIECCEFDCDITLYNKYGGSNSGSPIKTLVLDCVNAVAESQWIFTQLNKPEAK